MTDKGGLESKKISPRWLIEQINYGFDLCLCEVLKDGPQRPQVEAVVEGRNPTGSLGAFALFRQAGVEFGEIVGS